MSEFSSLFGKALLNNDFKPVPISCLAGKYVAVYFSAHWCGPCRQFTPVLKAVYNKLQTLGKNFEVVFCSNDKDNAGFKEYFGTMPWKAVPFENESIRTYVSDKFSIRSIPSIIILNPDGSVLNDDARMQIESDPEGAHFPWKSPSLYDMISGQLLSKTGGNVDCLKSIKGSVFGLYFSAHWCGPCRQFTPRLSGIYEQLRKEGKKFEIIFVSFDHDSAGFNEYYGTMPWLAIPFGDDRIKYLSQKYEVEGIPTLILCNEEGEIISKNGRMLMESNPNGYPWSPKTVESLSINPEFINTSPCLVAFIEKGDKSKIDMLENVGKEIKSRNSKIHIYYSDEQDEISFQIKSLIKVDATPCVVMVDIPDNGGYYIMKSEINEKNIISFVEQYQSKSLDRLQMGS